MNLMCLREMNWEIVNERQVQNAVQNQKEEHKIIENTEENMRFKG